MKEKEFIQSINNVVMARGKITETYANAIIRNYDFVNVANEWVDNCITFELTSMCDYAADGRAKEVYNCAKRIQEEMRACHMI